VDIEDLLPFQCWLVKQRFHDMPRLQKIKHLVMTYLRVLASEIVPDEQYMTDKQEEGNILFFRSLYRQDYIELFSNITDAYPYSSQVCFVHGHHIMDTRRCFRRVGLGDILKRWASSTVHLIRDPSLLRNAIHSFGAFKGVWLYLQFLKVALFCDGLLKSRPSAVVVFAEMQDMDRVLSWKCKLKGIPCASLQHGLYSEYTKIETVNTINYTPKFVSHFFAWGQHSHDLVKKHCPLVTVEICGKPRADLAPSIHTNQDRYACVVIFDQDIFKDKNAEMLAIVREVFYEKPGGLAVRFHPQNSKEDYDLTNITLLENDATWPEAAYYIGHTTTFLLDLLRAEVNLFRYATDAESVLQEPNIEFEDAGQLRTLLQRPQDETCETLTKYIAMTGMESIQAHIRAINNMVPSLT